MNEDNKTIAANICREHAKNYGGPATPATTMSAIVSELDKRDRAIAALKSKLGEAEKKYAELADAADALNDISDHENWCGHGKAGCLMCKVLRRITDALSSLRPKTSGSDGEGGEKS